MKIIVDVMGGDNAPAATLEGAAQAVEELGVQIIAVGDRQAIEKISAERSISMNGIEVVHASDAITMEDEATDVIRKRPNSSLAIAMRLLSEEKGDALVSAGSTGAVLAGATFIVKRIKGIKRAALGTVLPGTNGPWMLVDIGANSECRADMLVQFAVMGSAYVEKVLDVKKPKVGLVNNGAEESKGTNLQLEAFPLLKESGLNFIGNVEARELPSGNIDVVVCDGFTGNIILKLTEGLASMFTGVLKGMFLKNLKTKIAALMMKSGLADFKKQFDYTEYGGAPMLGIRKTVIKAHGSSNAKAFKNAIRQAVRCAEQDVPATIETWISEHKKEEPIG